MRQSGSEFINALFVIVESFTSQICLLEFKSAIDRVLS